MMTMVRRTREETYLRKGLLESLPSCAALAQLVVLFTPYIIAFVWSTTYMRNVFRSYNAGRTYGQVRLGKTHDHFPLA